MGKSIILLGVLDTPNSTNIPQLLAFQRADYEVTAVNYRTIIKDKGMSFFEELLLHTVKSQKPELVLFSKTNGINPELIKECNKYSKTFYWFPDPYQTAERIKFVTEYAKNATYASCTSMSTVDWFKERGVDPCYLILEGFDYDVLGPTPMYDKYKADISFIGTKTKERDMYKDRLEKVGYDVKYYGPEYSGGFITGKEFAKVCSSSKFMLSLNTYNNTPNTFSDRLILFTGCGACTLHFDSTKTLNNYFKDKEEVLYFSDVDELLQILNDTNDRTALGIAINGRERTLNMYTWDHTINQILTQAKLK